MFNLFNSYYYEMILYQINLECIITIAITFYFKLPYPFIHFVGEKIKTTKKKLYSVSACCFPCGIREIGLRLRSTNFNIQGLCACLCNAFALHIYTQK